MVLHIILNWCTRLVLLVFLAIALGLTCKLYSSEWNSDIMALGLACSVVGIILSCLLPLRGFIYDLRTLVDWIMFDMVTLALLITAAAMVTRLRQFCDIICLGHCPMLLAAIAFLHLAWIAALVLIVSDLYCFACENALIEAELCRPRCDPEQCVGDEEKDFSTSSSSPVPPIIGPPTTTHSSSTHIVETDETPRSITASGTSGTLGTPGTDSGSGLVPGPGPAPVPPPGHSSTTDNSPVTDCSCTTGSSCFCESCTQTPSPQFNQVYPPNMAFGGGYMNQPNNMNGGFVYQVIPQNYQGQHCAHCHLNPANPFLTVNQHGSMPSDDSYVPVEAFVPTPAPVHTHENNSVGPEVHGDSQVWSSASASEKQEQAASNANSSPVESFYTPNTPALRNVASTGHFISVASNQVPAMEPVPEFNCDNFFQSDTSTPDIVAEGHANGVMSPNNQFFNTESTNQFERHSTPPMPTPGFSSTTSNNVSDSSSSSRAIRSQENPNRRTAATVTNSRVGSKMLADSSDEGVLKQNFQFPSNSSSALVYQSLSSDAETSPEMIVDSINKLSVRNPAVIQESDYSDGDPFADGGNQDPQQHHQPGNPGQTPPKSSSSSEYTTDGVSPISQQCSCCGAQSGTQSSECACEGTDNDYNVRYGTSTENDEESYPRHVEFEEYDMDLTSCSDPACESNSDYEHGRDCECKGRLHHTLCQKKRNYCAKCIHKVLKKSSRIFK